MRELNTHEICLVDGGVSRDTVKAGARLLGKAFLTGIRLGTPAGIAISVILIGYDLFSN